MQTTSFHLRSTRFSLISIDGNNISDGEMILLGCQTDDQLSWDNDFIKKKKMKFLNEELELLQLKSSTDLFKPLVYFL